MKLSDLLSQVPGLKAQTVHHWRLRGYLTPKIIKHPVSPRMDYSEEDVATAKRMYELNRQGYSPGGAYSIVSRELGVGSRSAKPDLTPPGRAFTSFQRRLDSLVPHIPPKGVAPQDLAAVLSIEEILTRTYRQLGREPPVVLDDSFRYVLNPAYRNQRSGT